MPQGYGSRSVCLSVITLAATYLVCKSNSQCCKVPYDDQTSKRMICVDFAENTSFASFGVNFADSKLLDFSRLALA